MKANVGKIDRTLRFVVGLGIMGAGIYYGSWWGLIGLIPITTGLAGFCPAYKPVGLNTKS